MIGLRGGSEQLVYKSSDSVQYGMHGSFTLYVQVVVVVVVLHEMMIKKYFCRRCLSSKKNSSIILRKKSLKYTKYSQKMIINAYIFY